MVRVPNVTISTWLRQHDEQQLMLGAVGVEHDLNKRGIPSLPLVDIGGRQRRGKQRQGDAMATSRVVRGFDRVRMPSSCRPPVMTAGSSATSNVAASMPSSSVGSQPLRVLQFNTLADGLAQSGGFIKVRLNLTSRSLCIRSHQSLTP